MNGKAAVISARRVVVFRAGQKLKYRVTASHEKGAKTAKLSAEPAFSPEAYSAAGNDSLADRSADDFMGLSLRAAMRKASAIGLRVVAHGSGYVTDQRVRNKAQTGEAVYELRLEADE